MIGAQQLRDALAWLDDPGRSAFDLERRATIRTVLKALLREAPAPAAENAAAARVEAVEISYGLPILPGECNICQLENGKIQVCHVCPCGCEGVGLDEFDPGEVSNGPKGPTVKKCFGPCFVNGWHGHLTNGVWVPSLPCRPDENPYRIAETPAPKMTG